MKKKKVIHVDNIPVRLPFYSTITLWLFLDRMRIPSWGWGVYWTLIAIIWFTCIYLVWTQERAYVKFEEGEPV